MYHRVPEERESSRPVLVTRLPSFRTFDGPNPQDSHLEVGRTVDTEYKPHPTDHPDSDLESQELELLNPAVSDELKWEQEYNEGAQEDPNLVCRLASVHLKRTKDS